jgi:hypothetical protein
MNAQFVQAITTFLDMIERGGNSEQEVSDMMRHIETFAPNAELSRIIFYGERNRSPEEIADEAMLRERIWSEGGRSGVAAHVEKLMRAAIDAPTTEVSYRYSAMNILAGIDRAKGR